MNTEDTDEVGLHLIEILNEKFQYHGSNKQIIEDENRKDEIYNQNEGGNGSLMTWNNINALTCGRKLILLVMISYKVTKFLFQIPILISSPDQLYHILTQMKSMKENPLIINVSKWQIVSNSEVMKLYLPLFIALLLTFSAVQSFLTIIVFEVVFTVIIMSMKFLWSIDEVRLFSPKLTTIIKETNRFLQNLYSEVSLQKELNGRDWDYNIDPLDLGEKEIPNIHKFLNFSSIDKIRKTKLELSENSSIHLQSMNFAWAMKTWTTSTHQPTLNQFPTGRNLAISSQVISENTKNTKEGILGYRIPERKCGKMNLKHSASSSLPISPIQKERQNIPSIYIHSNESEDKNSEGIEVCKQKSPDEKKANKFRKNEGGMKLSLNHFDDDDSLVKANETFHSLEAASSIDASNNKSPGRSSLTDWVDVGTRLGIRLLNSESVKKISKDKLSETIKNKLGSKVMGDTDISFDVNSEILEGSCNGDDSSFKIDLGEKDDMEEIPFSDAEDLFPSKKPPAFPVHPMWTSPTSMAIDLSRTSLHNTSDDKSDDAQTSDNVGIDLVGQARNLLDTPVAAKKLSFSREYPLTAIITQSPSMHTREELVSNKLDFDNAKTSKSSDTKDSSFFMENNGKSIYEERTLKVIKGGMHGSNITPHMKPNQSLGEMDAPIEVKHISPQVNKYNATTLQTGPERSPLQLFPEERKVTKRHTKILSGCKIVVPIFSQVGLLQAHRSNTTKKAKYIMATVIACQRIKLPVKERSFRFSYESKITGTNCLSIHAQIDKSYLKNGNFAEVHFRVPDDISQMPRHSCYPIGACVATSFGIGVLAGWRVSDDIHIIRSLWKNRGHGSSCAYLRRDKIHGIVEAGIGFTVQTKLGRGKVLSYVQGGEKQLDGNFFVLIKESGRFQGHVIKLKRSEIQSCPSAKFVPVLEQIRAAAQFQIQMDTYKAALKEWDIETKEALKWSEEIEILFASFIKAIAEDPHFESELGHLTDALISFLEDLDVGNRNKSNIKEKKRAQQANGSTQTIDNKLESETINSLPSKNQKTQKNPLRAEPGLLFINDLMGGIFKVNGDLSTKDTSKGASQKTNVSELEERDTYDYDRAYAIIRMIKRALAIAQADVGSARSDLRLALSIVSEFVVFFQAIIKVRQINVSKEAADIRFRTLTQVRETLYPIQKRIAKVGESIMSRLENHGKKAKARFAYLFDVLVKDEKLLSALENGKWETCISRIERNVIKTKIVDASTCAQYHDKLLLIYNSLAPRARQSEAAALRSGEKIALFARIMKWMTEPRKVLLKFITRDDVLEVLERILVRVLHGDSHLSQVINIYAFNVRSFRYFRMLINMELSGKLWIPFLDAADDEISWAVTRMPDNTKEFVVPLAKLFSLGVSSFRELKNAELATNWMNFLTEEPARSLIHELDMKLVLFVEAFCNDIKQTMTILPYYAGLDDDILNLLDEVDLDELLNEMSVAILDKEKFSKFLIEKSREAVNRFLHYLPKMSIPIERRDVSDGWVLTCRGKNGGDLTLSEVDIESKNLVCKVLGSSNVFSSKEHSDYSDSDDKVQSTQSEPGLDSDSSTTEVSILDHVKELLINAQHYGSWEHGRGGVDHSISLTGTPLEGIPMSQVLSCAVELWQNLEIDDDELMEIVIRDISYQIQCQKESDNDADSKQINSQDRSGHCGNRRESLEESPIIQNRFNPRIDPTLLDLDLCGMTFHLDEFLFRVEPKIRYSIFDPVFEGYGSLLIKNTSIKLKVECRKERIMKLGSEVTVPILQLQQLDISLDKVKFKFKETGADWLLNKAVGGFTTNITEIVESNMKQQIIAQIHLALEHLNAFVEVNPDVMLKVLGITMDELEENIVWV